jgi:hypothetical protein
MAKKKNAKAAGTKKTTSANRPDFAEKYMRLRTILDSIEMGSLRFVLSASSPEEKVKRAEKLIDKLLPIAEKISRWIEQGQPASATRAAAAVDVDDDPCPDGYVLCHGVCVPYPCPPDSDGPSKISRNA